MNALELLTEIIEHNQNPRQYEDYAFALDLDLLTLDKLIVGAIGPKDLPKDFIEEEFIQSAIDFIESESCDEGEFFTDTDELMASLRESFHEMLEKNEATAHPVVRIEALAS